MIALLKVAFIMGQLFYWLILRDETREDLIWDACLYPGKENHGRH